MSTELKLFYVEQGWAGCGFVFAYNEDEAREFFKSERYDVEGFIIEVLEQKHLNGHICWGDQ